MATTVLMPETGTLLKWNYGEGDSIRLGDVLCEIETDKTVMEVEAEAEGVLTQILVKGGTAGVAAAEPLALISSGAEMEEAAPAAASAPAAAGAPPPGPGGIIGCGRIFSSPLARRLAKERGIDLRTLTGSGPGGRIVERDVTAAAAGSEPDPSAAAPAAMKPITTEPAKAGPQQDVPLDGMRRKIAERLVLSKQTIPHFYLSLDVELDAVLALRRQLNTDASHDANGQPRYQLTLNDFIVKALAAALEQVPAANAVWADDRIVRFKHADVGVAVAIEGGLLTPVIRNAGAKTLSALSNEIKELAGRARKRSLQPAEYQGGASAVSNLGMFGIKEFSAIINPPQSSILAVGAGEARVIVRVNAPVVATVMSATLSCDHRVIDGAVGAQLLGAFKRFLEKPINLLA